MEAEIRNDRFMIAILGLCFLVSLALANWYDTWIEVLALGLLSLGGVAVFYRMEPGSVLSRLVISVALVVFVILQIHQTHGLIEMHFGVFVGLALLFTYRDWRPLVLAATLFAIHHVSFFLLQQNNMGVWVFDNNRLGWSTVIIHAVYVVAETAALIWLTRLSQEDARISQEIIKASGLVQRMDNTMDLTVRCSAAGSPVLIKFNAMMERLDLVLGSTKLVMKELVDVIGVSRATNQGLVGLTQDELQRSEQIAVAMNELAQSVESLSDTSQRTAGSTKKVLANNSVCLDRVGGTQDSVRGLSESLGGAGKKIAALAENCKAISAVVDVIQGVAEQTNLLALNAAIEAARAGEQGRGFAVVADEVRALASRTSDSTKEINKLIMNLQSGSQDAVEAMDGCQQKVRETESHSDEVVGLLTSMSDELQNTCLMIQQIATAVEEQSSVSHEVSVNASGIQQTSGEISQNANKGLQVAAGAEKLVVDLDDKLNAFRVG